MNISFSKEVYPDLIDMLEISNSKCIVCKKIVDEDNIGGIMKNSRVVCDNNICLHNILLRYEK